jgi:hypothetical protein
VKRIAISCQWKDLARWLARCKCACVIVLIDDDRDVRLKSRPGAMICARLIIVGQSSGAS